MPPSDSQKIEIDYIKKELKDLELALAESKNAVNSLRETTNTILVNKFDHINAKLSEISVSLALAINDVSNITKDIAALKKDTVLKTEFQPIKTIIYTIIGVVALGVLYSMLHLVLIHPTESGILK